MSIKGSKLDLLWDATGRQLVGALLNLRVQGGGHPGTCG